MRMLLRLVGLTWLVIFFRLYLAGTLGLLSRPSIILVLSVLYHLLLLDAHLNFPLVLILAHRMVWLVLMIVRLLCFQLLLPFFSYIPIEPLQIVGGVCLCVDTMHLLELDIRSTLSYLCLHSFSVSSNLLGLSDLIMVVLIMCATIFMILYGIKNGLGG